MRGATSALAVTLLLVTSCGARSSLERTIHPRPANPDVVRACVMFYSCGGPDGFLKPQPNTVSNCIASSGGTASIVEGGGTTISTGFLESTSAACLASAMDCNDVSTCLFGRSLGCLDPPSAVFCAHNHAVACTTLGAAADDCSVPGFLRDGNAQCLASASDKVRCAFGVCDPATTAPCDGNVTQQCTDGLLDRWTCPTGSTCGGTDTTGCMGSGPACTADGCDGDTLAVCLGGKQLRIDCSALPIPSTCAVTNSSGARSCVPSPDLACNPTEFLDQCDGDALLYCDGDKRSVDCTTLGFHGCALVNGASACK